MKQNVFDVLAPGGWVLATFTNGNDTDNALFFRAGMWVELEVGEINTFPRETDWWRMRRTATHLKAGTGATNVEERRVAARAIRDDMILRWPNSSPQPVLLVGDMNLYTSLESGYGALTGNPQEDAQLFDPISMPGSWSANPSFTSIHTQSTRTQSLPDEGSNGGLDDRFDFILVDANLQDGQAWDVLPSSYKAWGQDGNHFNLSVNDPPANPVGQAVADALHAASDHLPVVVDFQEPAVAQYAPLSLAFGQVIQGGTSAKTFQLRNFASPPVDDLDYAVTSTEPGTQINGGASGSLVAGQLVNLSVVLDTGTARVLSGGLDVVTDDPGNALVHVPFSGAVRRPAMPSLSAGQQLETMNLTAIGVATATIDLAYDVANFGADALQAGLLVTNSTVTGPEFYRFQLLEPASFSVGSSPVQRHLQVILGGLAPGSAINATLTLTTQDDPAISGASARPSLVVNLHVTTAGGVTDSPSAPVARTQLHAPTPSPFNPRTQIRFELAKPGLTQLAVFDVRGRQVATLIDEHFAAGRHSQTWDGTDDAGRELSSGVYFVRLHSADVVQIRRAVLVR
jgi:hypothetical protein